MAASFRTCWHPKLFSNKKIRKNPIRCREREYFLSGNPKIKCKGFISKSGPTSSEVDLKKNNQKKDPSFFFPIKNSGKTQFDAVNESTSYPVTQKSNVKASFRKAVRLQAVDLKKNNHTARKNPIRCRKREHFLSCSSFFPI